MGKPRLDEHQLRLQSNDHNWVAAKEIVFRLVDMALNNR